LRIFTEPQQGATYDDLLAVTRTTEELGFDAFFRSDHYLRIGEGDPGPGPTDAWVTLAGLARETSRVRLGTLVTSSTFRLPGPLAVAVAQVDLLVAAHALLPREAEPALADQLDPIAGEPHLPDAVAARHVMIGEIDT
jgi:alkanesulfonate monooxygenase SsuD/methylene tetrahydromethanopterin reductase-like flavin-dependent oxidoreductase (luciferase family)